MEKKLAKWAWYKLGYLVHFAQINGEMDTNYSQRPNIFWETCISSVVGRQLYVVALYCNVLVWKVQCLVHVRWPYSSLYHWVIWEVSSTLQGRRTLSSAKLRSPNSRHALLGRSRHPPLPEPSRKQGSKEARKTILEVDVASSDGYERTASGTNEVCIRAHSSEI
jgi:hypothetical protein